MLAMSLNRKRSVSTALRCIEAFRLSINWELIVGCASTNSMVRMESSRIAIENGQEREVLVCRLKCISFHRGHAGVGKSRERIHGLLQNLADPSARLAAVTARHSLRGIRQHELVALFHGVDSDGESQLASLNPACSRVDDGTAAGVTTQRAGSCSFRTKSRLIQPKIIDFVIGRFSGRRPK